ncbi:Cof-type HAD-IIB family hydrolase [Oceanivirga miroungae]|uniref:Cof family hydrolase n=1 Tax=Oceanivirga miroungae TaxID=1130046 RepID=A0A6I8MEC9_9FUSO|nr:HAD family hydrolase [Oceanivirga miroungae]VWL85943.1 cof family hydrolase [Oceanivirga miroungae]
MKEKIGLIAIDFDGTFLDDSHFKKDLRYIDKIFSIGIPIIFASGRATAGIVELLSRLGIKDRVNYVIGHNGAEIYDVKNGKIIYDKKLDNKIADGIINLIVSNGFKNPIAIHDWEKLYTYNYDKRVDLENDVNFTKGINISKISEFPENKLKIMFFATGKEVDDIYNLIENSEYKENISQARNTNLLVEVTNNGVNKASALKILADKLKIELSDVLAFGNGENDKEMLDEVGFGYAMINSDKVLLENAKYITKYDNNNCGVEKEIIRIFEI